LRAAEDGQAPVIEIAGAWDQVIIGSAKAALEKILPRYLQNRRWFGGKARKIRSVKIIDAIAMPVDSTRAYFVAVELAYGEGDPETYLLPMAFAAGDRAAELCQFHPEAVVAQFKAKSTGVG
jgi:maltose alpha-D-glucosyltransferase/alpha-amylase